MRIIIILSIFLISFTNFFYAQESYQSIYTGQQLDSAAGSFLGNDFYRVVGGGEKNYPLSVQGLKDAIASLDSGVVYISYPGLQDTFGLGVVPNKVIITGYLFNTMVVKGQPVVAIFTASDSSQGTYFGIHNGLLGNNHLTLIVNKTPLPAWRSWENNQAQIRSQAGNINGLNISTAGLHDIIFSYDNWTESARIKASTGNLKLINRLVQKVNTNNVSNPPTAAELNSAFPNAEEGEIVFIDDNNGSTNFYQCVKEGIIWWIFTGVKAL